MGIRQFALTSHPGDTVQTYRLDLYNRFLPNSQTAELGALSRASLSVIAPRGSHEAFQGKLPDLNSSIVSPAPQISGSRTRFWLEACQHRLRLAVYVEALDLFTGNSLKSSRGQEACQSIHPLPPYGSGLLEALSA